MLPLVHGGLVALLCHRGSLNARAAALSVGRCGRTLCLLLDADLCPNLHRSPVDVDQSGQMGRTEFETEDKLTDYQQGVDESARSLREVLLSKGTEEFSFGDTLLNEAPVNWLTARAGRAARTSSGSRLRDEGAAISQRGVVSAGPASYLASRSHNQLQPANGVGTAAGS